MRGVRNKKLIYWNEFTFNLLRILLSEKKSLATNLIYRTIAGNSSTERKCGVN